MKILAGLKPMIRIVIIQVNYIFHAENKIFFHWSDSNKGRNYQSVIFCETIFMKYERILKVSKTISQNPGIISLLCVSPDIVNA